MYRSRSGDSSFGGKMLKILASFLTLFSLSAFACWHVDGSLAVDGEVFKFNQKVEHKKEYLFPLGNFILKFTLYPQDKKNTMMRYVVQEKKGLKLLNVTTGEEENIKENIKRDIFAKGEEGQPNSIITVKLKHI